MIAQLKSELRKVLTVRSTYFITGFVLLLVFFFGFYGSGWRINAIDLHNANNLASDVTGAIQVTAVFAALIAVLLVTHEYRYNTIMHTLTLSNSRSKVLLSKFIVISVFALLFTAFFAVLSPVLSYLGIHAHHLKQVHQTFHYGDLAWRSLFYGWGYSMAGLTIAALVRSQVAAIAILFIAPGAVEAILSLVLKHYAVYLPFTSLDAVIRNGVTDHGLIKPTHAALTFAAYLVGTWIVAWVLFLRRDAN